MLFTTNTVSNDELNSINEFFEQYDSDVVTVDVDDIKQEKKLLAQLRKEADFVIDTSTMKSAELYVEISELLVPGIVKDSFTITIESFGTDHKNEILNKLEKEGFLPKVVRKTECFQRQIGCLMQDSSQILSM